MFLFEIVCLGMYIRVPKPVALLEPVDAENKIKTKAEEIASKRAMMDKEQLDSEPEVEVVENRVVRRLSGSPAKSLKRKENSRSRSKDRRRSKSSGRKKRSRSRSRRRRSRSRSRSRKRERRSRSRGRKSREKEIQRRKEEREERHKAWGEETRRARDNVDGDTSYDTDLSGGRKIMSHYIYVAMW